MPDSFILTSYAQRGFANGPFPTPFRKQHLGSLVLRATSGIVLLWQTLWVAASFLGDAKR